jgi:hypothetical protein
VAAIQSCVNVVNISPQFYLHEKYHVPSSAIGKPGIVPLKQIYAQVPNPKNSISK